MPGSLQAATAAQTPEPQAQVESDARAVLSGVVKDQTGAVIVHATVSIAEKKAGQVSYALGTFGE